MVSGELMVDTQVRVFTVPVTFSQSFKVIAAPSPKALESSLFLSSLFLSSLLFMRSDAFPPNKGCRASVSKLSCFVPPPSFASSTSSGGM